jgi:hypothetical protein
MTSEQTHLLTVFLDQGTAQAKGRIFRLIADRRQSQGRELQIGVIDQLFVLLGLRGVTLADAKRFLLIVEVDGLHLNRG